MEDPKKQNPKPHVHHRAEHGEKNHAGIGEKAEETIVLKISAYNELQNRLEKAESTSCNNLDGWQRERAEFSNFKKRIEREQALLRNNITGDIIKKYLVIMDDMDLAMRNKPADAPVSEWANGIELISRKLHSIIESEGIEIINTNHVPFDPNIHEAISHEECPGFESGEVIEVFRQGYKLGDRILRPAMVRVAR